MTYYEYDTDGYLIGWYTADSPRTNSTDIPPPADTPANSVVWNGSGWVVSTPKIDKATLLADLWLVANAHAESQMDTNSRHSINLYLADPTLTEEKRAKILAYSVWWRGLWEHYAVQKAKIEVGLVASFDAGTAGMCPYTIWDIAEA